MIPACRRGIEEFDRNANGRADVGEDLVLSIPLTNPLSTALTGVTASVFAGGTASYGTIAPGVTITQNIGYKVPVNLTCSERLTASVVVNSNLGQETKTFKLQTGTPTAVYAENFDSVTAPALPAGWTTTNTRAMPLWTTSTTASDTAPNAEFTSFPGTTSSSQLVSPTVAISPANAQLTFRHSYNSEFQWDGGVLEISIQWWRGVGGTLTACVTLSNVEANVYDVSISIGGNYYTGSADTVLAIYDPSLGFVSGGGTIIHNGNVANFGFNVKYLKNGNAQGSLIYIEHRPTGDVKLKSNSLQSLSIVGNTGVIIGKATLNDVGNHSFRATVVDNGEPGSSDQFGLQVTRPGGATIPDLTFNPIILRDGNIQVPQL